MDFLICNVGVMDNNCYLLYDEDKNAICIDPADQSDTIIRVISENALKLKAIVITHAHFDHIFALDKVYNAFKDVTLYATKEQKDALCNPDINLSSMACAHPYVCTLPIEEAESSLEIGKIKLNILKTPGHTEDSVCFYTQNKLFSGDTLFAGTIGRTDFPGGSIKIIRKSLENLKTLPEDTEIYPGHGASSTIKREVLYNPYMQ